MVKSISHVRTRISSDTFFTVNGTNIQITNKIQSFIYLHVLSDIIKYRSPKSESADFCQMASDHVIFSVCCSFGYKIRCVRVP